MTPKELHTACEAAGGIVEGEGVKFGNLWHAYLDHPALPAYVASLLAAKAFTSWQVDEMDTSRVPYAFQCEGLAHDLEKHTGTGDTAEAAIIRAAMEALK